MKTSDQAVQARQATTWDPPPVPSLRDFFGTAAQRQRFLAYWRRDGIADSSDYLLFALFQLVPTRFGSWLAGFFARRLAMPRLPGPVAKARAALRRIRPELDEAERERLLLSHFDNQGRVMAEFPLLMRLGNSPRLSAGNVQAVQSAHRRGPLILVGLHTANWEVASPFVGRLGIPVASVSELPPRAAQIRIARLLRDRLGMTMLTPDSVGMRHAVRLLRSGSVVAFFGDEERNRQVMAPFFGAAPHTKGNLGVIARMARLTGAQVMTFHGERLPRGHYQVVFGEPLAMPSQTEPGAPLLDDVVALNAAIEPIIRAHCGRWFYLESLPG